MTDVAIVWQASLDSEGDWALNGPDLLLAEDDLDSAVLISLFTDRRADPDGVIPDGSSDPRGWWADGDPEGPIGSKLWLRARSKATLHLLTVVKDDIVQSLQWLLNDGVAASVVVNTFWLSTTILGATIDIARAGQRTRNYRFDFAWGSSGMTVTPPAQAGGALQFNQARNFILFGQGL